MHEALGSTPSYLKRIKTMKKKKRRRKRKKKKNKEEEKNDFYPTNHFKPRYTKPGFSAEINLV